MADGNPDGTPDAGTPDDAAGDKPKWKINWKKVLKYGLPIVVGLAIIAIALGIFLPTKAKDPVARADVKQLRQDTTSLATGLTTLDNNFAELGTKVDGKADLVDLTGLQQETQRRDGELQAAIDDRPTKATVDNQIAAETQARTAGDTDLGGRLGAVETALADPANPGAGITDRLKVVEDLLAPPPPVPPPDQVGHRVLNPVR